MKSKVIALLIAFSAFTTGAYVVSVTPIPYHALIAVVLAAGSIGTVALFTFQWLSYVSRLVVKTSHDAHLNQGKMSKWSFENIDRLEQNQEAIKKKFELSAQYIAKLGQADKLDDMDELLRNDTIGEALLKIKSDMHRLKGEEDKRNWITQGLARFSEILRNKEDIKLFGNQVIGNLVRYLNANQGALYIEYQDEVKGRYLDMIACYAYDKVKHLENRIYEGQGILGQCMLEQDFIYMKDIPANYIRITSGLGEATPRNIVIAPLILKEKFYGLIELASFELLEPHQIEFIKRVSENIASEISSIRSIEQTQSFLDASKSLTYELQQSEEEMRQSMEELRATQEQMYRKQMELDSYLSAINNTIASVEFDLNGKFVLANDIFLKVTGYSQHELSGNIYSKIMRDDATIHMMWDNLREGKFFAGEFTIKDKYGKELWLSGTLNPITTGVGRPEKIMMYAQFTTQEKEKANDLTVMVNALKYTLPVVEFNEQLVCKTANEKFLKMFHVTRLGLKNKNIYDFIDPFYRPLFEKIKSEILTKDFSTLLLPFTVGSNTVTFEASVTVAQNLEGNVSRIILILVKEVEVEVHALAAV
jgi:PAS domain S-box-containing protein